MNHLYGRSWHDQGRFPVQELTEAKAKKAWGSAQVAVACGADLAEGVVPDFTVVVNDDLSYCGVDWYTPGGAIARHVGYFAIDGEPGQLFLSDATEYTYPDEERWYSRSQASALRLLHFRPDGYAESRTRLAAADSELVEEFTGVDVAPHWVAVPQWGDWERWGSLPEGFDAPAAADS